MSESPVPTTTPLPLASQPWQLVLALALRYGLLRANQAEFLVHRQAGSVEQACQALLEDGYLTTRQFCFLLPRADEVRAAGGRGPTGSARDVGPLELAGTLGYLTHDQMRAFLEEQAISLQLKSDLSGQETAYLPLLYNLGYLELYQVIDLLEKKGIRIDHCERCRTQTLAFRRRAEICRACGVRMQRLTGWETEDELRLPLPRIRMLLIRRGREPQPAEQDVELDSAVPGADEDAGPPGASQTFLVVEEETAPAEGEPQPADDAVFEVIRRYRMLDAERTRELDRVRQTSRTPLVRLVGELGFLPPLALAFLHRQTGPMEPLPDRQQGLLALAIERRYLSPGVLPHGAARLSRAEELSLLARTYNNGVLSYWQLIDLLATLDVPLEHCETCKIQLHAPQVELAGCPGCDGALLPLHRPEQATVGGALPAIEQLLVQTMEEITDISSRTLQAIEEAAPSRPAGRRKAGEGSRRVAPLPPPPGETDRPDPDRLVEKLIVRYGLMSPGQLRKAMSQLCSDSAGSPLETRLLQDGHITASELSFLAQKLAQATGGVTGELYDQSLTDIAVSKGYLNQRRLMRLSHMPGAPDFGGSDDIAVAAFLLEKGALTFYQAIDLMEEIGFYLVGCAECRVQYQLVGEVDPSQFQICPACDAVMVALTTPPGWPLLLGRLPAIESLDVRRMPAHRLSALNASAAALPVLESKPEQSSVLAQPASLHERQASGIHSVAAEPVEREAEPVAPVAEPVAPTAVEPEPAPRPVPAPRPMVPPPANMAVAEEQPALAESSAEIEAPPALQELVLDAPVAPAPPPAFCPPAPAASKLEQRRLARKDKVAAARDVIQTFYEQSFPERQLQAQPVRHTQRMDLPAAPGRPSSTRLPQVELSPPQALRVATTGQIVEQGVKRITFALGAVILLLVVAVGWAIWATATRKPPPVGPGGSTPVAGRPSGPVNGDAVSVAGEVTEVHPEEQPSYLVIALDLDRSCKIVCTNSETTAQLGRVAAAFKAGDQRIYVRVGGDYHKQAGERPPERVEARQIQRIFRLPPERLVLERR